MSGDSEDESTALINEAKKKSDAKIFKTKIVTKHSRAINDPSKVMDLLKEQNESNKQFFANVIKVPQEIEREERERESFFK